jgi:tetratricopeptide (TPR) repeat protein
LKEAVEAAKEIESQQWRAWTLQAIAEVQAKAGDREGAARTYREAIQAAREIKDDQSLSPEHRISQTYHTLGWIAVSQAESGDVKGGLQTAEAVEDDGARDYAQANIACARARGGDVKGALETAEIVSVEKKDWVLTAVARAQAEAGQVKDALRTAEKIGADYQKAQALVAVARAQARAKDSDAAGKSLRAALKIANDLGGEGDYGHVTFGRVAEAQAEMGDAKEARRTIDAITKAPWKDIALRNVVAALAGAGDVKGALETAEAIEGEYWKGDALKEVVAGQFRAGDLKGAQQTAGAIKNVFGRVAALAEIAKGQAKAGDRAAAAKTFQKVFDEAGNEAENVRDEEPGLGGLRHGALCRIVGAQAEAGQEKEAYAWAIKQTPPLLKAKALLEIARGMALRKEAEK